MKHYNKNTKQFIYENYIENEQGTFFLDVLTKAPKTEFGILEVIETEYNPEYQYLEYKENNGVYEATVKDRISKLEYLKERKIEELKKVREAKINEPLNNVDVRSEKDLDNIDGSIRYFESLAPNGKIRWTMADDTDKEMAKAELEEILRNYALRKAQIFATYQAYKVQVFAAQTEEALNMIVWE